MKYFKPELLARCRSLDSTIADAADAEWEQAIEAYRGRYKEIRRQLPPGVNSLESKYYLHDAKVLGVSVGRSRPRFYLLLRVQGGAGEPNPILALTYHLVTGPGGVRYTKHPVADTTSDNAFVLYDEFDLDEQGHHFIHRLLLTDGLEFEIRFHGLSVREIVSPTRAAEMEKMQSLVGA